MSLLRIVAVSALVIGVHQDCRATEAMTRPGLQLENGWFVHNDRMVWGYAQHNAWWKPAEGANLTRRFPNVVGPNRTEDLNKLTVGSGSRAKQSQAPNSNIHVLFKTAAAGNLPVGDAERRDIGQ